MAKTITLTIDYIKEVIQRFYKNQDADSFFEIVDIYNFMTKNGYTKEDYPIMIELSNIIVLG